MVLTTVIKLYPVLLHHGCMQRPQAARRTHGQVLGQGALEQRRLHDGDDTVFDFSGVLDDLLRRVIVYILAKIGQNEAIGRRHVERALAEIH